MFERQAINDKIVGTNDDLFKYNAYFSTTIIKKVRTAINMSNTKLRLKLRHYTSKKFLYATLP